MTPRAKSFPIVERVEEQDLTQPRFWTIQRYPTTDEQFPLVQIVQVRTPLWRCDRLAGLGGSWKVGFPYRGRGPDFCRPALWRRPLRQQESR